ncbi:MAG: hypothetical protein NZL85_07675 [Fimbriimonadales bacterium]|nr:hypothetical protein [Fimbriimonadales bacterium]
MAITLSDLPELVRLLQQHPEWREALRLILLGEELIHLPQLVHSIAENQKEIVDILQRIVQILQRHEQLLEQLIEQQQRNEERFARAEERFARVEEQIARLVEQQQRNEEQIARLVEQQQRNAERFARLEKGFEELRQEVRELRSEIGHVTQALGLTVEEHADDILLTVMERKGWKLLRGPNSLHLDGELDLIAVFEDPEGRQRTVLMEVKLRLSRREVEAWADRVRSEGFIHKLQEQGFNPPYHPYLFGFRIDVAADDAARRRRMGLITSRGELLEPEVIEVVSSAGDAERG